MRSDRCDPTDAIRKMRSARCDPQDAIRKMRSARCDPQDAIRKIDILLILGYDSIQSMLRACVQRVREPLINGENSMKRQISVSSPTSGRAVRRGTAGTKLAV